MMMDMKLHADACVKTNQAETIKELVKCCCVAPLFVITPRIKIKPVYRTSRTSIQNPTCFENLQVVVVLSNKVASCLLHMQMCMYLVPVTAMKNLGN